MIVYDLRCEGGGHCFEGWFGSSRDFDDQQARSLIACPDCGSVDIVKAAMAPRLTRKGNQQGDGRPASPPVAKVPAPSGSPSPEMRAVLRALATAQAEELKASRWVGNAFAEDARAMHYGDKQAEAIHGKTTPEQARDLLEEGIAIAPVLFPVASPEEIN